MGDIRRVSEEEKKKKGFRCQWNIHKSTNENVLKCEKNGKIFTMDVKYD